MCGAPREATSRIGRPTDSPGRNIPAIAAELGETAVGSDHFQVLFTIGILLFAMAHQGPQVPAVRCGVGVPCEEGRHRCEVPVTCLVVLDQVTESLEMARDFKLEPEEGEAEEMISLKNLIFARITNPSLTCNTTKQLPPRECFLRNLIKMI